MPPIEDVINRLYPGERDAHESLQAVTVIADGSDDYLVTLDWGWADTVLRLPYARWANGVALAVAEACECYAVALVPEETEE